MAETGDGVTTPPPTTARSAPGPDGAPYLAAVGVGCLLLAAFTALQAGYGVDDAFITLAYAKNLATGNGMTFQGGERLFAVTTPLWCWLNAAVMAAWPAARIEPLGAIVLTTLAHAAAGFLLERVARRAGAGHGALVAPVVWILYGQNIMIFGMEHGAATALALGGVLLFLGGRHAAAGCALAAMCLVRPEGALLPLGLVGILLVRRSWRNALRFAVPLAAVGGVSMAGFAWYYGTPVPNTFGTKRAHLEALPWIMPMGEATWAHTRQYVLGGPVAGLVLVIAGIGAATWSVFQRQEGWHVAAVIVAWAAAHVGVLAVLGVGYYDWYLWPYWIAVALLAAKGAGWLVELAGRRSERWRNVAAVAVTAVVLANYGWQWLGDPAAWQRGRRDSYRAAAESIADAAAGREVSVFAAEVGALRFYMPDNVAIVDSALVVMESPIPGAWTEPIELISWTEPEFYLESHPRFAGITADDIAYQDARLDPGFVALFPRRDPTAPPLRYDIIERYRTEYGLVVLFERDGWRMDDRDSMDRME